MFNEEEPKGKKEKESKEKENTQLITDNKEKEVGEKEVRTLGRGQAKVNFSFDGHFEVSFFF